MSFFDRSRLAIAAQALGFAQGALERAIAYIKVREQGGKPIASLQVPQHQIATMATQVQMIRELTYQAARIADNKPDTMLSAMAKLAAAEQAWQVVDRAVQLFGGNGYMTDQAIARYLLDCRVCRIYEGAEDIMRHIIAGMILGK